MKKRSNEKQGNSDNSSIYYSPQDLAERWRYGRSSVDRIARRGGFTRMCLGTGKNGMVRYLKKEVVRYEKTRMITMR